jgi:flagellar biosynthesis/type III secretory pathway chaperone
MMHPADVRHGMTDRQIMQDMHGRLAVLEATCETLCAQQRAMMAERGKLIAMNRMQGETIIRLMRAKESLLEALGRLTYSRAASDARRVDIVKPAGTAPRVT